MTAAIWDPYCGTAPLPQDLIGRWNLDPVLLVAMAAAAALHLLALFQSGEFRRKEWFFAAGWLLLSALFISPLCALSSALFSVRVAHHVILIALIAPIFLLSLPDRWRALPFRSGAPAVFAFIIHTSVVWFWHAPSAYTFALSSDFAFWVMQLSLAGSALVLWLCVLSPGVPLGSSMAVLLGSVMQMGLLGALITFAPRPLYPSHLLTTEPFGLSALADQQLAGLIMWVPAVVPYLAAALVLFGLRLARPDCPESVR
ncbi:MAG: cytochrome c oxidase assembly protein [Alphaproteobacteria bacterium]